jgi:hypothetical protein
MMVSGWAGVIADKRAPTGFVERLLVAVRLAGDGGLEDVVAGKPDC